MTFTVHLGWWFIPLCITVLSVPAVLFRLAFIKHASVFELLLFIPAALFISMISWIIAGALK